MGEGAARLAQARLEGQVRPADALAPVAWRSTGTVFDELLGRGLPRGRVVEIVGLRSSGRTAWAVHLAAALTRAGSICAWVDPEDRFDPASAEAAGVVLSRLVWVRGKVSLRSALVAIETLARVRGIAVVFGDLEAPARRKPPTLAAWARLARAAEGSGATIVLVGETRMAGTFAAAAVELRGQGARWARNAPRAPAYLTGLLVVPQTRSKLGAPREGRPILVRAFPSRLSP